MTSKICLMAGGATLAAGLWFLAGATAAPVDLTPGVAKSVVAADAAALNKKFEDILAAPEKNRGAIRTARSLALSLAAYGDEATQGQAAAILLALGANNGKPTVDDLKKAAAAAKGLSAPKANPTALKDMHGKFDLEDVMSQFRIAKSGGMNIEKDIRDGIKAAKIEAKDAELIGARSAGLAVFTEKMPNDKAKTSPAMTAKWERWAKEMGTVGKELAEEGGKGAKSDAKKLVTTLKRLDATCSNCHNDFRNE